MKIFFACDLDGTLIHSHRNKRDGDICVEVFEGREISFISQKALELLEEIVSLVNFVPVTTRSTEQFKRIKWLLNTKPKQAVVSNGAILLENDCSSEKWKNELSKNVLPHEKEMQMLFEKFENDSIFEKVKIVDEFFLFCKCKEINDAINIVLEYKDKTSFNVEFQGKKVYFFPKEICKGKAIQRFKNEYESNLVICAGDSTIDVPMFFNSDIAYAKSYELIKDLDDNIQKKTVCLNDDTLFSEFILTDIINIVRTLKNNGNI